MASLINIIRTVFSTEGADSTIRATDAIGRAQTRLGQSSSGSGRQFAAQSSGLGGLVASYAGAAATIYTLQAAFDALSKAAAAENIVKGTNALALEIGQSGPRILKTVQDLTQGQLTLAAAAENTNLALSAGFSTTQIESLTKISVSASRALGRDLSDSFDRLVKGAAKLQPELLDELGIFTRINPAVEAYAHKMNISTSSLTNFERRQAFVNAIIDEGNKKFNAIDVSAPSAQKSLQQLLVQVTQLATGLTQLIANALKPVVDFFSNDIGNSLLLFGGILSTVFSKATQVFSNWTTSTLHNLSSVAAKLAQVAEIYRGTFGKISEASSTFKGEVTARGGLQADTKDSSGKKVRGTGSFAQGAGLTKEEISAASEARQRFISGGAPVGAIRTADVAALTVAQTKLAAAGKTTSVAHADATKILTAYGAAAAESTIGVRLLTAASSGLAIVAEGLTVVFGVLMGAINILFTVIAVTQLVGTLFDVDILGTIKSYFVDISEKTQDMKDGFIGLTTAAAGGADKLTAALKRAGATDKDLANVNTRLSDMASSIDAYAISAQQAKNPGSKGGAQADVLNDATRIRGIQAEIAKKQATIAGGTGLITSQADIEQAKQDIIILQAFTDAISKYGTKFGLVVGQISRASGMSTDTVAQVFGSSSGTLIQKTGDIIDVFGQKINIATGGYEKLTDAQKVFVDDGGLLVSTLSKANESFASGSATSDKLSEQLAGATSTFQEMKKAGLGTAAAMAEAWRQIQKLSGSVRDLQTIEVLTASIEKTFSGQIGAVDSAPLSGFVSLTGKLATNTEQAKSNQIQYLAATISAANTTKQLLSTYGSKLDEDSAKSAIINAGTVATKAMVGELLQQIDSTAKILATEKARTIELTNQLTLLKMQDAIAITTAQNQVSQTATANQLASGDRQLEIGKANLSNLTATHSLELSRIDANNKLLDLQGQLATAGGGGANAAAAAAQLEASKNQLKAVQAEQALKNMERDPYASQKELEDKKRANIELERQILLDNYEKQKAAIMAQGGASKAQLDAQLASYDRQQQALQTELQFKAQEQAKEQALFAQETINIEAKIQSDIDKNANDMGIIQATKLLDHARLDAQERAASAQSQAVISQLQGYQTFADSVVYLIGGIKTFSETVSALLGFLPGGDKGKVDAAIAALPQTQKTDLSTTIAAAKTNMQTQTDSFKEQHTQVDAIAALNYTNLALQRAGLQSLMTDTKTLRSLQSSSLATQQEQARNEIRDKIKQIDLEKQIAIKQSSAGSADRAAQLTQLEADLNVQLQQLDGTVQDLAASTDVWNNALNATKDTLRSSLTSALSDLNKSLFDTSGQTESFGQRVRTALGNVFKAVQSTFFDKTIAEPVSNFITDSVFKLFGGKKAAGGIETVPRGLGGALLVQDVSGGLGGTASSLGTTPTDTANTGFFGKIFSGISSFFTNLFSGNGIVANLFNGIFGKGGIVSSIFSGLMGGGAGGGGFLGSIFSAIGSIFGLASGGVVHMAQGGMVNSHLRDRVPAMLEPGEFVVNKLATKRAGIPALNSLNGSVITSSLNKQQAQAPVINMIQPTVRQTPTTSGASTPASMGDVTVNVSNEGSPKTAIASPPRFDGDKYVIDVVMRDLSNNGPIRRSLRGGAL